MRKILFPVVLAVLSLSLLFLGGVLQTEAQDVSDPAVEVAATPSCYLSYDKTASPGEVDAGGVTTVAFELQSVGDCSPVNSPVDVMLVIDRSGSMWGGELDDAKQAAKDFVDQMNLDHDYVGVASFSWSSALNHGLSQNDGDVKAAIDNLGAGGGTNIAAGLVEAEDEFNNNGHPANAPVIIVLSDGYSYPAMNDANRIKQNGGRIISVGLGNSVDEALLKGIASSEDDYYHAPTSGDLGDIYSDIGGTVRVGARDMVITDTLSIYDSLVANSFQGPVTPTVSGDQILWHISAVPTTPMTLTYRAAMTDTAGDWETNDSAVASYIDANGSDDLVTFPSPTVTVRSQCGQPVLNDIQPSWGCVVSDTAVMLTGGGFVNPTATIGSQNLTVYASQNNAISATLASGLSAGLYDVGVVNECQMSALLRDGFQLYPEPSVLSIRPEEGYNTTPSDLTICGEAFAPGTKVYIDDPVSGTLELENQAAYGKTCLAGTVPSGLQGGEQVITVQGPCGAITGTYRVLTEGLNNDLWGMGEELWLDPSICARDCDDISMGMIVHRRGGKYTLQDVNVRFYEGNPDLGATLVGTGTISQLSPRVSPAERIAGFSTSAVAWTPPQTGTYTLYAVIDPHDVISEDIEINNVVSRTVQVLPCPPEVDRVAPRVDSFEIKGGIDTTYNIESPLSLSATDFPWPGPNTGVARMNFVEYLFNDAADVWVPVQVSGWQTFAESSRWSFYPEGGMRFLQAWASDGAGNISRYPNFKYINYVKPCAAVSRDGVRIYRQNVEEGDILHVEVAPCNGDPDLYIWPSDWKQGQPPWVKNQSGDAVEQLSIPITTTGEYQIEVYGYTSARYNINIEVEEAATSTFQALLDTVTRAPLETGRRMPTGAMAKGERNAPAVPPSSMPGTYMIPVDPAPYEVSEGPGTLKSVMIDGPPTGSIDTTYTYTATVLPQGAGTVGWPITYTWEATGQAQKVHPSGSISSTDTVTFSWSSASPATKTITVTVSDGSGSPVFDNHETVITAHNIYLPLVIRNS